MALSEAEELELLELENEEASAAPVAAAESAPEVSKTKSAALGASQGASLGFGDEGSAAVVALAKKLKGMATGESTDLRKDYSGARDSLRGSIKEAETANPKTFLAGEFAGGAATMAMPGLNLAKGGNLAAKMAALGGLQGLGNSEADLLEGDAGNAAVDTAVGAGTGLVLGKASPYIAKAASKTGELVAAGARKVGEGAKWLGKKAITSFMGPSDEAIEALLKNPNLTETSFSQLVQKLPEVAKKFDRVISGLSDKADEVVSSSPYIQASANDPGGAFTKDEVFKIMGSVRRKLGGIYTDESETAARVLGKIGDRLEKIRSTVSQKQVLSLVRDLDEEIPWEKVWRAPENLTPSDHVLINLRTRLDGALKSRNPAYEKIMKPVSEAIQGRNEFLKSFGLKRIRGQGYSPEDTAYSKLRGALREGKTGTARVMENTKATVGEDLAPAISDASAAEEFAGGITQGSRKVNAWAGLGAGAGAGVAGAPGAVAGGAVGAATGAYMDKQGGPAAASLIRGGQKAAQAIGSASERVMQTLKVDPQKLGKYAGVLGAAARQGTQAVTVRHFVLMNTDAEYRQKIRELEGISADEE